MNSASEVIIRFPDGYQKSYPKNISISQIAEAISPSLLKRAIAAKFNDRLVDLSYVVEMSGDVVILTDKDAEGLEIIRHSCAHLLGHAVKSLFPEAQITIGPVVGHEFYYDIAYKNTFTMEDLQTIEAKMHELAKANFPVTRFEMTRKEAIEFFTQQKEFYKVEIIESIPGDEVLSFYKQDVFVDLCRGPHVPSTGMLKAFKLTSVAGAYWRGDAKNAMLQRIYGTAFASQKDLEEHLHRIEEAEKRDHRKLAKALDLYHIQEESPGGIFWHPKGWLVWQVIEQYMRKKFKQYGYKEVKTPQIVDRVLWERSGHWDKFGNDMFTFEQDERWYAIKPMSCPCHIQIFNQGLKSYRDLPIRFAEFGSCHRNEASGALHGLLRTRNFVQDDGHIFCTREHIGQEIESFINMLYGIYADFGFTDISVKLSTRPEQRVGSDEMWDEAETVLAEVLNKKKLNWQLLPGEGAFYGPKIEFVLTDALQRQWTTGSIQLDFSLPLRLGAEYVAETGQKEVPVMLHRAIFGSLERFIGILIEHYAGLLPAWLAPLQAVILTITSQQHDYAVQIAEQLQAKDFRVEADLRNEKVGYKIREYTLQKVPYLLIIGDKEKEAGTVSVRLRNGTDLGSMSINEFIGYLEKDVAKLGS